MTWLGFDHSRTADGTARDCADTRSHNKEFILFGFIIGAAVGLGWFVGSL